MGSNIFWRKIRISIVTTQRIHEIFPVFLLSQCQIECFLKTLWKRGCMKLGILLCNSEIIRTHCVQLEYTFSLRCELIFKLFTTLNEQVPIHSYSSELFLSFHKKTYFWKILVIQFYNHWRPSDSHLMMLELNSMNSDQAEDTQFYNFSLRRSLRCTIPWSTQIDLVNDIVVVF